MFKNLLRPIQRSVTNRPLFTSMNTRAFSSITSASGQSYEPRGKLFINGQWKDAKSGATYDNINPGTGKVINSVAAGNEDDIAEAVAAAKAAGPVWESVPPFVRASLMNKYADKIEANMDELIALESEDIGKPFQDAANDIGFCSMILRYYAGLAMDIQGSIVTRDSWGHFNNQLQYSRKSPVGVCGLITPWNFPALLTMFKIAPMLASGSTGVHKSPDLTPLTSLRLVELWHEIEGVPPGVLNAVPGDGAIAGEALTTHSDVNKIAFTGSTRIGKHIMGRCAQDLKKLTLELGGKGPLVVFGDGDVQKAAFYASMFGLANSGQFCAAPTRLIVEESVYDEFVANMLHHVGNMKTGYWKEEGVNKGPVVSQAQKDSIMNYIKIGKESGADLLCGGNGIDRDGFFIEPTIFGNVGQDDKLAQDEIFGPVLSIIKFKSGETAAQDALNIANNSQYGLMGGVFTKDAAKQALFSQKLECGTVCTNNYASIFYDSEFGGLKQSGIGQELGHKGLESYLKSKTVIMDQN